MNERRGSPSGRLQRALAAIAVALLSSIAQAGFISTNEAGLDAIFGAANLSIDIRFNAPIVVAGSFDSIDDRAELDALFSLGLAESPTVELFFVKSMSYCTGDPRIDPFAIGCGAVFGNKIAVVSAFAASADGAELIAHELGHNLGLFDLACNGTNLMCGQGFGNTSVTDDQAEIMVNNPLVQGPNDGRFISITPIMVVSAPGTSMLLALGLGGLLWNRRIRHTRTV
jgi:hypothetical protein